MFSMDYIIPGIDPTGSMTAAQRSRPGRGGGGGNLLGNIFCPLGVESKGHAILYHYFIFLSVLIRLSESIFHRWSPPPQTGAGGGSSVVLASEFTLARRYLCSAIWAVFTPSLSLVKKAEQAESDRCDQPVDEK